MTDKIKTIIYYWNNKTINNGYGYIGIEIINIDDQENQIQSTYVSSYDNTSYSDEQRLGKPRILNLPIIQLDYVAFRKWYVAAKIAKELININNSANCVLAVLLATGYLTENPSHIKHPFELKIYLDEIAANNNFNSNCHGINIKSNSYATATRINLLEELTENENSATEKEDNDDTENDDSDTEVETYSNNENINALKIFQLGLNNDDSAEDVSISGEPNSPMNEHRDSPAASDSDNSITKLKRNYLFSDNSRRETNSKVSVNLTTSIFNHKNPA